MSLVLLTERKQLITNSPSLLALLLYSKSHSVYTEKFPATKVMDRPEWLNCKSICLILPHMLTKSLIIEFPSSPSLLLHFFYRLNYELCLQLLFEKINKRGRRGSNKRESVGEQSSLYIDIAM